MKGRKVLVVEDELRIRELICDCFVNEAYQVVQARDGREAMELFAQSGFDLVILDIMIPEVDGWSVCRRMRKTSSVPIIILTARLEEEDKLMGFELGADEYVTKPFSPRVLLARARVLLQRAEGRLGGHDAVLEVPGIQINLESRTVRVNGSVVEMTHKEYELLLYLIKNKGIVVSREQILNNVWESDYMGETRTVDTHIKRLRSKMGDRAGYISTVIRTGYIFEVEG